MDDRTRQQQEQARISQPIVDEMRQKQQILEAQATQQIQEELARYQPRIQQQQEEYLRQLEQQYVRRMQAEANNPLMQQMVQMEWSNIQPQLQEELIRRQEQEQARISQPIVDEMRRKQQILEAQATQQIQEELARHRHQTRDDATTQQPEGHIPQRTPAHNPTDQLAAHDPSDIPPPLKQVDEERAKLQDTYEASSSPRVQPRLPHLDAGFARQQAPHWTREAADAFCIGWAFFLMGERVVDAPTFYDWVNPDDLVGKYLHANWLNLDVETRKWISQMPQTWEYVRTHWNQMSQMQRKRYRDFYQPNFMWFHRRLNPDPRSKAVLPTPPRGKAMRG